MEVGRTVGIQMRTHSGLDQAGWDGGGEQQLDVKDVLQLKPKGVANRQNVGCREQDQSWIIPQKNGAGAAIWGDEGAVEHFLLFRGGAENGLGFASGIQMS